MSWWPWAKGRVKAKALRPFRILRAKFDSAQTTPDNRRHWASADGLSADSGASPEVYRLHLQLQLFPASANFFLLARNPLS